MASVACVFLARNLYRFRCAHNITLCETVHIEYTQRRASRRFKKTTSDDYDDDAGDDNNTFMTMTYGSFREINVDFSLYLYCVYYINVSLYSHSVIRSNGSDVFVELLLRVIIQSTAVRIM